MIPGMKVPTPTLERLATYFTVLSELKSRRADTISSANVEDRTGINAAQFRKDLSYFGEFGRTGIGYNVNELHARIITSSKACTSGARRISIEFFRQ